MITSAKHTPDPINRATKNLRTLCSEVGIDLQGKEGHPYHCSEQMQTKMGILGIDYAHCQKCELTIGNAMSPHINGGHMPINAQEVENSWLKSWFIICESTP